MPIRPELRPHYRKLWHRLSKRLREERAGNACECTGICGGHIDLCGAVNGGENPRTGGRVVLTVAHLHQDPRDHHPDGLMVMCASCHLRYDRSPEQRALRHYIALEIAGQTSLLVEEEKTPRRQSLDAQTWLRAVRMHKIPSLTSPPADRAQPSFFPIVEREPMTVHRLSELMAPFPGWSRATIRRRMRGKVRPLGRIYDDGPRTYDPFDIIAAALGRDSAAWLFGIEAEQ